MAYPASREDDAWSKIPIHGDPPTFKRFEVDVKWWWLAGEDWWRVSYRQRGGPLRRQADGGRAGKG